MRNKYKLLPDFGPGRDQPVNGLLGVWCLVFVLAAATRRHFMFQIPMSHKGVILTARDPQPYYVLPSVLPLQEPILLRLVLPNVLPPQCKLSTDRHVFMV